MGDAAKYRKWTKRSAEALERVFEVMAVCPLPDYGEKVSARLDAGYLRTREEEFRVGKSAGPVLAVIAHCLSRNLPIPGWAAMASLIRTKSRPMANSSLGTKPSASL
jgi:hypothetical protein